jgi:shikimate kinase/3-dehydroquinate synthase
MSDGVVIVGLSGAGKTTIGQALASALGRPFVDVDELVAGPNGDAGARLRSLGEPAFREAEARAIDDALRTRGAVIATGGGAVENPVNRWRLWHHGTAVWLDAADETLLARLATDSVPRPLLDENPAAAMANLRAQREPFYRAADVHLDATDSPRQVVDRLAAELGDHPATDDRPRRLLDAIIERHHVTGGATARLVYGRRLLPKIIDAQLDELGGDPAFIVDRKVDASWRDGSRRTMVLRGGERAKRIASLHRILEWLAAERVERTDPLVAVGGGTMGDLAGLAAAMYARGLPWLAVPTTWLAQADAALGGKVALDLQAAKNAVGAFWPPSGVIADVEALASLPRREARNGIAECIKAALICDDRLWHLIEDRGVDALRGDAEARYAIIERAARVKMAIVDRDPFEAGERRSLNLGHTVGHALEVVSRYRLPHGAAVGLGMCVAASLAAGRGGDPELRPRLNELLEQLGLPTQHSADPAAVHHALTADKKRRAGRQRWILPMAIGTVIEVDDVSERELETSLREIGIGA